MAIETVTIMNREEACLVQPTTDMLFISITCPDEPAPIQDGYGGLLRVEFDDVDEKAMKDLLYKGYGWKFTPFDNDHARKIVDFLENFHNTPYTFHLIVHCDAGISRSSAVGKFVAQWLDTPSPLERQHHPNTLVFTKLCEVSGLNYSYLKDLERMFGSGTDKNRISY